MKSRLILNLILVSVVTILVVFTIYEPGQKKNDKTALINNFDPQKINTLVLERGGSEVLILKKKQSTWHISKPFDLPANDFQVNALLSIANNHSYSQFDAQQHDLDKFGLLTPRIGLRFDNQQLYFGGTDPLSFRRYVLVDNTIHLINDGSYLYLSQDVTKFVSYKLLPDKKIISKIQLPGFQLEKNSINGRWQIQPKINDLSADDINIFIERWQHVQALVVKPWLINSVVAGEPLTGEPKENSSNVINIKFTDNSELALVIIDDKTDLIVGKSDSKIQYEIAEINKNKLLQLGNPVWVKYN
ncbi:MAG TPA: DUF4340 domain-containing protein [candidate division Zixibacteria bacterium]|nr:DUF4340 domain-containing protein [candidate division Zixibacteria bacterium]